MIDAFIKRSRRNNVIAILSLAALCLLSFGWNFAMAETAQELSPSELQDNKPPPTIDSILDDAIKKEVTLKPFLTPLERARFIAPVPSEQWKLQYSKYVMAAAEKHKLPPDLIMAVIAVESGYNHRARNGTSYGLMQIKLATARGYGLSRGGVEDLMNPVTNITVASNYLGAAWKMTNGNVCATVSRYNRGLGSAKLNRSYCAKVARIMKYADFQIE